MRIQGTQILHLALVYILQSINMMFTFLMFISFYCNTYIYQRGQGFKKKGLANRNMAVGERKYDGG